MENLEYTIEVRKIKNPRLEFKHGQLFVIVPNKTKFNIPAFINRHKNWISKHKSFFESVEEQSSNLKLEPRVFSYFLKLVEDFIKSYSDYVNSLPKEMLVDIDSVFCKTISIWMKTPMLNMYGQKTLRRLESTRKL